MTWDSPRSLLVQMLSRDQKSLRLVRIDAATGHTRSSSRRRRDTWVNLHDDLRVVGETGEIPLVVRADRLHATWSSATATATSSGL